MGVVIEKDINIELKINTVALKGSRVLQIKLHFIRLLWKCTRPATIFPTTVTLSEDGVAIVVERV